jgi:hypothetical protein
MAIAAESEYARSVAWKPAETPWQHELLQRMPPSIDPTQIIESLRLTPTERIERMLRFMAFAEDVRRAGHDRRRKAD